MKNTTTELTSQLSILEDKIKRLRMSLKMKKSSLNS